MILRGWRVMLLQAGGWAAGLLHQPWEPQFYSFNLAKKPPLAVTNRDSTGYSTMGGCSEQIRTKDNSN